MNLDSNGIKNILMIAPTPFFADRGCHVRILEEAQALKSLGTEVTICTYHNGNNVPGLDIRRIPKIPWYNKLDAGPSYHMPYLDFLLLLRSLQTIHTTKFDVIHAHLHEGVFIGKFCSKLTGVPLVFDVQGSLSGEMVAHKFLKENSPPFKLIYRFEGLLNNTADAIITSSSNMANILIKEFNINNENVFLVQDGVNTDVFRPDYDVSNLRIELNISVEDKVVVYTGLLNIYQGIDHLLKAIPYVEVENVKFLIVGFPNVEKYKKIAKDLNISDKVIFTGKVPYSKIPLYLAVGDIAISPKVPTSGEANLKLYTYMSSALPTVVFDHPVNREILGDLGIYARLGSSTSLAHCLTELLSNEQLCNKLSSKLREKAIKEYSWINAGEKIMEVYKWVT